jgi:hypothetical protein
MANWFTAGSLLTAPAPSEQGSQKSQEESAQQEQQQDVAQEAQQGAQPMDASNLQSSMPHGPGHLTKAEELTEEQLLRQQAAEAAFNAGQVRLCSCTVTSSFCHQPVPSCVAVCSAALLQQLQ